MDAYLIQSIAKIIKDGNIDRLKELVNDERRNDILIIATLLGCGEFVSSIIGGDIEDTWDMKARDGIEYGSKSLLDLIHHLYDLYIDDGDGYVGYHAARMMLNKQNAIEHIEFLSLFVNDERNIVQVLDEKLEKLHLIHTYAVYDILKHYGIKIKTIIPRLLAFFISYLRDDGIDLCLSFLPDQYKEIVGQKICNAFDCKIKTMMK